MLALTNSHLAPTPLALVFGEAFEGPPGHSSLDHAWFRRVSLEEGRARGQRAVRSPESSRTGEAQGVLAPSANDGPRWWVLSSSTYSSCSQCWAYARSNSSTGAATASSSAVASRNSPDSLPRVTVYRSRAPESGPCCLNSPTPTASRCKSPAVRNSCEICWPQNPEPPSWAFNECPQ